MPQLLRVIAGRKLIQYSWLTGMGLVKPITGLVLIIISWPISFRGNHRWCTVVAYGQRRLHPHKQYYQGNWSAPLFSCCCSPAYIIIVCVPHLLWSLITLRGLPIPSIPMQYLDTGRISCIEGNSNFRLNEIVFINFNTIDMDGLSSCGGRRSKGRMLLRSPGWKWRDWYPHFTPKRIQIQGQRELVIILDGWRLKLKRFISVNCLFELNCGNAKSKRWGSGGNTLSIDSLVIKFTSPITS